MRPSAAAVGLNRRDAAVERESPDSGSPQKVQTVGSKYYREPSQLSKGSGRDGCSDGWVALSRAVVFLVRRPELGWARRPLSVYLVGGEREEAAGLQAK